MNIVVSPVRSEEVAPANCEYQVRVEYGVWRCLTQSQWQERKQDELNSKIANEKLIEDIQPMITVFVIILVIIIFLIARYDNRS